MIGKLTKRQQEALEFIQVFQMRHGFPPTCSELGSGLGITASSAYSRLWNMERKGAVKLLGTARGIKIL